jgi:hypothetical protein
MNEEIKKYQVIKKFSAEEHRIDGGAVTQIGYIFEIGSLVYGKRPEVAANWRVTPEFYTNNVMISRSDNFSKTFITSKENLKEISINQVDIPYEDFLTIRNKNIVKYKIARDYDAPYLYDYDDGIRYITAPPTPSPTRKFYKGDIVDAITYQGKIVSSHYDITAVAEPYDDKKTENEPQPESKQSKIFTTNNILIGLAAIAVIGMGYYIIKK